MRTHRHPAPTILLAALCLLGGTGSLAAQSIRGRLLERRTDRPIPAATIAIVTEENAPVGQPTRTGSDGSFSLSAPASGDYRLRAQQQGYRTAVTPVVALESGDQVALTLRLAPDGVEIAPVSVTSNTNAGSRRATSKLGRFSERRQRARLGRFIPREEIERSRPHFVSDLLLTVPGLQVVPSPRGIGYDVRTVEGCRPQVYLDGLPLPLRTESIDQIVAPEELEGIEVYAHAAEVPAEFSGPDSACGAIVLWTRGSQPPSR